MAWTSCARRARTACWTASATPSRCWPRSPAPLDAAAHRLCLRLLGLLPGEHGVERRAQPGCVLRGVHVVRVGSPAVAQPALGIEDEHVGRGPRAELAGR